MKELSFEGWLLVNVGKFVFHLLPSWSDTIAEWHDAVAKDYEPWLLGICIPYGTYGGIGAKGRDRFRIVDAADLTDQELGSRDG